MRAFWIILGWLFMFTTFFLGYVAYDNFALEDWGDMWLAIGGGIITFIAAFACWVYAEVDMSFVGDVLDEL